MATLDIVSGVLNINASQGKTWTVTINVTNSAGSAVNLTGYSAKWQIRETPASSAVLSLANGSGITLTSGGVITMTASSTATAAIPAGSYAHEIELIEPSGAIPPFLAGNVIVLPEIVQ
jgi:hypothetical protein